MTGEVRTTLRILAITIIMATFVGGSLYAEDVPPSPYWKNQITFPNEPFRVTGSTSDEPDWVKFTILLDPYDPNVVYFQDSLTYEFHYHFAVDLLPPFAGMTPQQFDQATLYENGRQAILGAVIMPPSSGWPRPPAYPEYGIQFVGNDPFTKEQIAWLFDVAKASILADTSVKAFYFPSYEQIQTARENEQWFADRGIEISSASRWAQGNSTYSQGWAVGTLKYFAAGDIENAYLSGTLAPQDILLTDGVPAETPFVAGILTLSPSTPNSHVAILAKTFNVPFAFLALADDANDAMSFVGDTILLRAYDSSSGGVRLTNLKGLVSDDDLADILKLKEPPQLDIPPMTPYGAYTASTAQLTPADIQYFGGKAANYGLLRQSIPDNCPFAIAVSFDLWREFLDQTLSNGKTLREEIDSRLAVISYPPSDMAQLSAILDGIRDLFKDTSVTHFTPIQQTAILSALQDPNYGFQPDQKIRFRSSTNVEDSDYFTGAGLYDSYSGCLLDDLDADETGPSLCDPQEHDERGVLRAIRKVFASFYNDNAYLERRRYKVDETSVGMAMLVHHSFPDEIELANGVAVLSKTGSSRELTLVTQEGATSVTNPTDGSIPEEVRVDIYSFGQFPTLIRQSNLVPLGATVLQWDAEYVELAQLLLTAAGRFSAVTGLTDYTLDFEYKKTAPDGKLVIKQIRQIPRPSSTDLVTPLLVGEPVEFETYQGEYADVFADHRLKCRLTLNNRFTSCTAENLGEPILTEATMEYADNGRIRRVCGYLPQWPFASYESTQRSVYPTNPVNTTSHWVMHHLDNPRSCGLKIQDIPTRVRATQSPILTLQDFGFLQLQADYDRPVITINWQGQTTTSTETVRLSLPQQPAPGDIYQQRTMQSAPFSIPGVKGRLTISTSFYWPPEPGGVSAGYTAPLNRWIETTITGLTTDPIVLHSWYSQTYRPGHHNFTEEFLFEPQLEPGISQQVLERLRALNIRLIYAENDYYSDVVKVFGFDDAGRLSGDIDGDKDVDFADMAMLLSFWGQSVCDDCGGADLEGDGRVNAADIDEIARFWLAGATEPASI